MKQYCLEIKKDSLFRIFLLCLSLICSLSVFSKKITVTSSLDSVSGSLRSAVDLAISGDTIIFKIEDKSNIIYLKDSLSIQKSITIDGLNITTQDTIIIHQTAEYQKVILIGSQEINVTLKNIKLTNGQSGALYIRKKNTVNLLNCHIDSNFDNHSGFPGIFINENCTINIIKSTISNCKLTYSGNSHAFYSYNSDIVIEDSFFYKNDGRAIYVDGGSLNIKRTDIFNNHTGLKTNNAILQMSDCYIYGNEHSGYPFGGGLLLFDTKSEINKTSINNNIAGQGAAIYCSGGELVLKNSQLTHNRSGNSCAGLYLYSKKALIEDCDISDNSSWSSSCALDITNKKSLGEKSEFDPDGKNIIINRCTINNNKVIDGSPSIPLAAGGINAFGPFYLSNSTISSNTANYGAGLYMYLEGGKAYLINNTFYNNTSKGATNYYSEESAIFISLDYIDTSEGRSHPKIDIINNTITYNNSLTDKGTGIYWFLHAGAIYGLDSGSINLYNNIIAYNGEQDMEVKISKYGTNEEFFQTKFAGKSNILNIDSEISKNSNAEFVNYKDSPYLFKNNPAKLDDNGGSTKTIALSNQSLAKESGTSSEKNIEIPTRDQRGVLKGAKPSIGAIEYEKYEEEVSGIAPEIVKPVYNVTSSNRLLSISGLAEGDILKIYSIKGNIVYNKRLYLADFSISLDPGLYIIKINEYTQKILIH